MSPFLLVSFFLLFFTLFTSNELKRCTEQLGCQKIAKESAHAYVEKEFLKERSYFQEFSPVFEDDKEEDLEGREKKKKPEPLKPDPSDTPSSSPKKSSYVLAYDTHRPPNNAMFNMYLLLDEPKKNALNYRELFVDLLYQLYGNYPFFQAIPHLPEQLLDWLLSEKEEIKKFTYIDDISSLKHPNPQIAAVFYHMLKGDSQIPSLLHYVGMEKKPTPTQKRINLLFAPKELLKALLPPQAFPEIYAIREALWKRIEKQEELPGETAILKKQEIKKLLEAQVTQLFQEKNINLNPKIFDYGLGKSGNTWYYTDPNTKLLIREPYISRK